MGLAFGNFATTPLHAVSSGNVSLADAAAVGDWIMLFIGSENHNNTSPISTIVSGGSLGWTKRKQSTLSMTNGLDIQNIEVWYAPVLSTIGAFSLTAAVTFANTIDGGNLAIVKVTGAPLGWDPNLSLPAVASNLTQVAATPSVSGVTTSNPDTLMIGVFAGCLTSGAQLLGTPTGFTQDVNLDELSGSNFETLVVVHQLFSTKQSGLTVAGSAGAQKQWGFIIDAITSDAGAPKAAHVNFCVATG